ncbi:MAG: hypothetical protein US45_C0058G0004 [Candidatus Nomurabacteria bacterium GW2011_GWA1_37_20]|uniref:DUF378 domain-containing protein n=1 Tax=Candidatus Nomurabacteria bacterium GW2011_GWA1_37_20 TaxID=1618729 RepID=A0A0G0GU09_9BACT|nr:MAG: hypothetical protein US45_C0058G0004 [Candidatus Nomurabacteria bacterium GW2011_GWA1_37_20]
MLNRTGSWKGCCTPALIGEILLMVGGVNWGLVGVGMLVGSDINAWNVVHMVFGSVSVVEGIIYVLVGIAAVMMLIIRQRGLCNI